MRVIITGGTGLIGRHLSASLAQSGYEVIVLSRTPEIAQKMPANVRVEFWDARTTQNWGQWVDGNTAIVNLAGAGLADQRWTDERKKVIRDSRVDAGKAVVEAVHNAAAKPRVVIQASAVGYYGVQGDETLTEESAAGNDFPAEVCKEWEQATAEVESAGVRRAVIRTGVVLSMDGGAFPRMLMPFRMFVGGPIGTGKQWFPWIHIEDEIRAIRFLMEKEDAKGVYNLSAPNPLTNASFGRVLGSVIRRPAIFPTPAIALQMIFGEMAMILLEGQKAVPHRLVEAGFQFTYPEAEEALKNILH